MNSPTPDCLIVDKKREQKDRDRIRQRERLSKQFSFAFGVPLSCHSKASSALFSLEKESFHNILPVIDRFMSYSGGNKLEIESIVTFIQNRLTKFSLYLNHREKAGRCSFLVTANIGRTLDDEFGVRMINILSMIHLIQYRQQIDYGWISNVSLF